MIFRNLGLQTYEPIWRAMQRLTDYRTQNTADEIWFLEHHPVYTQGMAGKAEHILNPVNIPVVAIDRGGQVTYHGPGQLVVYFLLDMQRRNLAPRQLVSLIEEALVRLLASYGLTAYARQDAPGVYVQEAKIASIGLRIRNNASYHGLSLNIAMDLNPFKGINPCGFANMPMTQLSEYVLDVHMTDVQQRLQKILHDQFIQ